MKIPRVSDEAIEREIMNLNANPPSDRFSQKHADFVLDLRDARAEIKNLCSLIPHATEETLYRDIGELVTESKKNETH